MTAVIFGLFGPIVVIMCLVCATNVCGIYTFKPRCSEVREVRKRYTQANNGVKLDEFPEPGDYNRKLAQTLQRATWR